MSKINDDLYKSKSNEWKTHPDLINTILTGLKIERFDCDVCTSEFNVPANKYYTEHGTFEFKDGEYVLSDEAIQSCSFPKWQGLCWMNPPYGVMLRYFVIAASGIAYEGNATIISILPVRTENKYYHESVLYFPMYFFEGRLEFINSDITEIDKEFEGDSTRSNKATFATMLVCFTYDKERKSQFKKLCDFLHKNNYRGTYIS